ncbi:hypothetical protein [Fibrivirga algicola]|uniref:Alginate export domain-containing protein n=1 Tax=Fibrivirga algicola TaxID=2950420 RepID=A0ABX0QBH4_9BACT|nr:hypothetical protein [Fibrivirga algicola]NID09454.1 hypothetical protein [Fibrivirga algicola]
MKKTLFTLMLALPFWPTMAQHEQHTGHSMPMPADTVKPKKAAGTTQSKTQPAPKPKMDHSQMDHSQMDHSGMNHGSMNSMNHGSMDGMNHSSANPGSVTFMPMGSMSHYLSRNLPMNRNGSGTSWMPDKTPMYAYMAHSPGSGKWMYMLHYSVFLRHTNQSFNNPGKRGREARIDAPNWAMGMAQRTVGKKGLFTAKLMMSLDPLTVGNGGYPLLFQTGESYRGEPLVDRQHPHDLFSELSVSYSHAFSRDADAFVYVGYPGEPALGAPAFMHRISSFNNPDSPLSHHWIDATHITFGTATAGFRYKIAKVEFSQFTGREPDEFRYNFDKPRFDSYSYRLSVNPTPGLALQVSQGMIKNPEVLNSHGSVRRTTASVLHSTSFGSGDRYMTSALIWGVNNHDGVNENAYLAETSLQLGRLALYGRYENVTKSLDELVLPNTTSTNPNETLANVDNLTLGTNWRLLRMANTDLAIGTQFTVGFPSQQLRFYYGDAPLSGQVYLRLTPALLVTR